MVPDVDIAAQVGRDFFLDEKIPRHESGQGYVKVLEHSVMWKETAASKIFTYQGLTTRTEVENGWTVMSSVYNHLRQGKERSTSELSVLIRTEGEQQERLEVRGYRSPTWRLLRRPLSSSVQVEAQLGSGVRNRGRQSFCGRAWAKKDEKNVRRRFAITEIG